MTWLCSQDAAAHLGISDRTLRRRLRTNQYNHRREGRMVLVELDKPDTEDRMATIGDHFAEASKANAITTRTTADAMAALSERHRIEVQTLRRMNVATTVIGCLASASLATVVVILALAYDGTRDDVSAMRVEHVRQEMKTATLRAERDQAVEERDRVLDAHLASYGFQVADAGE